MTPRLLDALAVGETTTDTFSYTVSDGNGSSDTASVTVTITPGSTTRSTRRRRAPRCRDGALSSAEPPQGSRDQRAGERNCTDRGHLDGCGALGAAVGVQQDRLAIIHENDAIGRCSLGRWRLVERSHASQRRRCCPQASAT